LSFNTLHGDFSCPFCNEKVVTGVGFRYGAIANELYRIGDEIGWQGAATRPATKPNAKVVKTVGYFNCDNIRCSTWQDCFPRVQRALITIENNRLKSVAVYDGDATDHGFDIVEPEGLS
jgi:hypothetical protein